MVKSQVDHNILAATKYASNGNGRVNPAPMDIEKIFAENTFGLEQMKSRLPKTAFRSLLARFPDLTLAVEPDQLSWRASILMRGLTRLPVRLRG